jgi:hypothetical protein
MTVPTIWAIKGAGNGPDRLLLADRAGQNFRLVCIAYAGE